nr:deoxyribodipyrimidine photolyase [Planctomycetota bacterium]
HYSLQQLEAGATHDPVWNAAQTQLRREGMIPNYLRMLWGKLTLAWKSEPEQAFDELIHLNNKWALDGRNPNSWSGVAWCFGRYDRAWAERPIYGKLRYMTTASALRKLDFGDYCDRFAPGK